jgi:hypothetical protein
MRKIYCLFISILFASQLHAQYAHSVPPSSGQSNKQSKLLLQEVDFTLKQCDKTALQALDESADPIQTISTEGRLKGDPVKTATQLSLRDFNKIYSLCLRYRITGQEKYLNKAVEYLLAWAKVNQPGGNPIDDTNYDPAIEGYSLIKSAIPPAEHKIISNWLSSIAAAEIGTAPKDKTRETAYNNWNSHRLKVIGEIGFALRDTSFQQFAIVNLKKQLAVNLLPDGSGIDFKLRDALHYHVYDLEPLLKLAMVIKNAGGINFYTYESETGSSIKKSVSWLIPYLTGEKTHEEFVNSSVAFDQKRAKNGEAGYQKGTLFDPSNGLKTLALAGYFDPSFDTLYQKLKGGRKTDADLQIIYRIMSEPSLYLTGK